jgi:hypothetical protein
VEVTTGECLLACILLAVAVKGCPPVDNTCWYQQGYLDQGWERAAVEAVAAKFSTTQAAGKVRLPQQQQ